VKIPVVQNLVAPSCSDGCVSGLYRHPWGWLHVNRGFSSGSVMPIRFRCPPEVTFFEVAPAKGRRRR
jgi:predicted MPP superfamily phosphohydrolase